MKMVGRMISGNIIIPHHPSHEGGGAEGMGRGGVRVSDVSGNHSRNHFHFD
jgi:hypothetical protein